LDSKNAEAVMDLLRELHREGATIVMVTHDPRYSLHAERAVHMLDGMIVNGGAVIGDDSAGHTQSLAGL
jgi:putative ABC transport system ATP-binding protein